VGSEFPKARVRSVEKHLMQPYSRGCFLSGLGAFSEDASR
jgi:hypothetical protein